MPVFCLGHGMWKPEDGYCTLPKGTSITFYTQNAKLLNMQDAYSICRGDYAQEPDGCHEEYKTVPNMTLMHVQSNFRDMCNQLIQGRNDGSSAIYCANPGSKITLKNLVKHPLANGKALIWIACRQLVLKNTGKAVGGRNATAFGGSIGVNARERAEEYYIFGQDKDGHVIGRVEKSSFR